MPGANNKSKGGKLGGGDGGDGERDEAAYLKKPIETLESAKQKIEALVTARIGYDNSFERGVEATKIRLNAPREHARELYDFYDKLERQRSRDNDARAREIARRIMANDAKQKDGGISRIISGLAGRKT